MYPVTDQIPAESIKAGGRTIRSEIHKFINCIWSKENWLEEWKESIILPIYKKNDTTDCSNYRGISLLPNTYKIFSNNLFSKLASYSKKIIWGHQCGFDTTGQPLIIYSAFFKYLKKIGIQRTRVTVVYKIQEGLWFS